MCFETGLFLIPLISITFFYLTYLYHFNDHLKNLPLGKSGKPSILGVTFLKISFQMKGNSESDHILAMEAQTYIMSSLNVSSQTCTLCAELGQALCTNAVIKVRLIWLDFFPWLEVFHLSIIPLLCQSFHFFSALMVSLQNLLSSIYLKGCRLNKQLLFDAIPQASSKLPYTSEEQKKWNLAVSTSFIEEILRTWPGKILMKNTVKVLILKISDHSNWSLQLCGLLLDPVIIFWTADKETPLGIILRIMWLVLNQIKWYKLLKLNYKM